jgi:hypothetical protein
MLLTTTTTTVNLKLERGFKDKRRAPNRSKQVHYMKKSNR